MHKICVERRQREEMGMAAESGSFKARPEFGRSIAAQSNVRYVMTDIGT